MAFKTVWENYEENMTTVQWEVYSRQLLDQPIKWQGWVADVQLGYLQIDLLDPDEHDIVNTRYEVGVPIAADVALDF